MTALHGVDPCWRCGDSAHWASECDLRKPAHSLAEHERRLQLYIDRFVENKISTEYKRELIAEEHELWRNRKSKERKST